MVLLFCWNKLFMSDLIAKNYNYKLLYKAPLPFLGQKRNWIRYLPELINGNLFEKGFSNYKKGVWVDMFGGSGLLSYNIKQLCPDAEVIYNDFDGYSNYLTDESADILKSVGKLLEPYFKKYKHREKTNANDTKEIRKIYFFVKNKYKQKLYLTLLHSCLWFGPIIGDNIKKIENRKNHYINSKELLSENFHEIFEKYLHGLNVIKGVDFKELIQQYKDNKNAVFICDPPYLNTCTGNYKSGFDKNNFDFLVENIRPPFIAFSSMKNNLRELLLAKFPNAKHKEHNVCLGNRKDKSLPTTTDQMIWCVN